MNELLLLNYKLLNLSIFSEILKNDAISALMKLSAYSVKFFKAVGAQPAPACSAAAAYVIAAGGAFKPVFERGVSA